MPASRARPLSHNLSVWLEAWLQGHCFRVGSGEEIFISSTAHPHQADRSRTPSILQRNTESLLTIAVAPVRLQTRQRSRCDPSVVSCCDGKVQQN